jgi:xylan 1,4-beta-xylosidase
MIELSGDAKDKGEPLEHFWSTCVGAGRAAEGLRADWQEHLRTVAAECGYRYVRFHGLFHDDMFVYREENGIPVYNFQYVDALFDRLLEIGVRPFVELGFSPRDLATVCSTVFWWGGHGSPPKDYGKWAELIRHTVRHWTQRYGIDEVRLWYFEVWNEPNLAPFFQGTKQQYFELYRVTAQAVKEIDASLRVGGPSTSNFVPDARFGGETEDVLCHAIVREASDLEALDWQPVWVEQFLTFCCDNELPVDFVSCHPYPTDWALDEHGTGLKLTRGVGATPRDLARLHGIVKMSEYPNAEIHLTEWSSSSSPRDHTHDYPQAATFVVRANLESIGQADSLAYWTFTDVFEENGAGDTMFHGGFGMITLQGVVKPTFHAYRFLHALGDELLSSGPGGVVTRHQATGELTALAYHYPSEMPLSVPATFEARDKAEETLALGTAETLRVALTGLRPGAAFVAELLDPTHGNAIGAWQEMKAPEAPSREQTDVLRRAARGTRLETVHADAEGRLQLERTLESWAVMLLKEVRS